MTLMSDFSYDTLMQALNSTELLLLIELAMEPDGLL